MTKTTYEEQLNEELINDQSQSAYGSFWKKGLLFNYQSEFRSKWSTEQAVNLFIDRIRREAD